MASAPQKPSRFGVFQHEEVSKVEAIRRREKDVPAHVLLSILFLALGVASWALTTPLFEPVLESWDFVPVSTARMIAVSVAVGCAALLILCVSVLIKDARMQGLVADPKHLLGASLANKPAPATPATPSASSSSGLASKAAPSRVLFSPSTPLTPSGADSRIFSPSTPPVRSPLVTAQLTDEKQLNSFLQRAGSSPPSFSPSNVSLSRSPFAYQTAYRLSGTAEHDLSYKESEAAKLLLQRLRIELSMHSEWPYRMRRWISSELVEKCVALADELKNRLAAVERIARVEYEREEKKMKLQQQQQQQLGWGASSGFGGTGWGVSAFSGGVADAWGGFGGTVATEDQLKQTAHRRAEEIVQHKHDLLQRYLDVTQDRACKEYVLDRLRHLADGGTLSSYEWNGGEKFRGQEWSPDSLPTDAQVLFHLFVTKLNELLKKQAEESGMDVGPTPFSNRYLLITPQHPDPKNKDVLLWLQRRNPPHIKVVVRGEVWETMPGQNNLIHALVLYVYAVAKEERGVIEMLSLLVAAPELLKVVAERK